MGFWSRAFGLEPTGITPNDNGPDTFNPGDPDGIEFVGDALEARALPILSASGFDGWPTGWATPDWQKVTTGVDKLVDIAWQCLDLQSNIVSSMPVYRTKNGAVVDPVQWMNNPDPTIYSCWQEFAKQVFWDYQMGEVFIVPGVIGSDGYPSRFRVIPPAYVDVQMSGGRRVYKIGTINVTDEILHIRYSSTTTDPRGRGPLEIAGAKMTQIRLLQRYANNLAETGGVPLYWLGIERRLTPSEGKDLLANWIESRGENAGHPAILGSGASLNQAKTMDAKEMGLLEISQFSESRIAGLLGVPPFLVGLAGASGSLTYSNISDLFDFHDRSSLRPKTRTIMESMSAWALPRGQAAEFNRDDYTRLPLDKRMAAYQIAIANEILTAEEVRVMERYTSSSGEVAAQALTGGESG